MNVLEAGVVKDDVQEKIAAESCRNCQIMII